jgi:hypothetical protein
VRTLLALALLAPVAAAQDEDTVPVAPPPRLKALPTARKKAAPPKEAVAPIPVTKAEPTPEPAPKVPPAPEPAPKTVAKADTPSPAPAPKVEVPVAVKADSKSDAKDAKPEEKPAAAVLAPAKSTEPSFHDWTLPLYAVYAFGALALLVVIRTYVLPPRA